MVCSVVFIICAFASGDDVEPPDTGGGLD